MTYPDLYQAPNWTNKEPDKVQKLPVKTSSASVILQVTELTALADGSYFI
jgi:hypothetical protein